MLAMCFGSNLPGWGLIYFILLFFMWFLYLFHFFIFYFYLNALGHRPRLCSLLWATYGERSLAV